MPQTATQPPAFDPWGVDTVTLVVALIAVSLLAGIRKARGNNPAVTRRRIITDFLHASVIYPFLLLMISVPSVNVFEYLKGSRLVVGLAGGVGLFFVIGELLAATAERENSTQASQDNSTDHG